MSQQPEAPLDGWLPDGVVLGDPVALGGSRRSVVQRRAVIDGPPEWGDSVVVKRFLPQPESERAAMGWRREVAGLRHLGGVPRLLAQDRERQSLVMEDLGAHPTLADALLGVDADAAWRHTLAWAAALGSSVTGGEPLARARRALGTEVLAQDREVQVGYPRRGLTRLAEVTGVDGARAATAEALDLVDELRHDSGRQVLGPGDACPDNALLTPQGVRLVDLEAAGVRHLAYEAAYAAEPFSTCWCVLEPPAGLTAAMLEAFTDAAASTVPDLAEDPDWPRQVRGAVALWVLSATLWLLDGALEERSMAPAGRQGPTFRALLVSRWRRVARESSTELPGIAAVCEQAVAWAGRAWAGSPLELAPYPAFSGRWRAD